MIPVWCAWNVVLMYMRVSLACAVSLLRARSRRSIEARQSRLCAGRPHTRGIALENCGDCQKLVRRKAFIGATLGAWDWMD